MGVKKYLGIFFVLILFGSILFLMFGNVSLTGETVISEYTFTKAVCDENNYCQDYEIHCRGEQVLAQIPIQGSERQYQNNWEDPRTKEQIEKLCD
tara:strand:- start:664 stop:948 length:285 start_codon:yes stop_codon:yes gene_type:complete